MQTSNKPERIKRPEYDNATRLVKNDKKLNKTVRGVGGKAFFRNGGVNVNTFDWDYLASIKD